MTTGQDGGRRLLKQGGLRPDLLPVEGAAGGHALRGRQQSPPAAPDAAVAAAPDAAAAAADRGRGGSAQLHGGHVLGGTGELNQRQLLFHVGFGNGFKLTQPVNSGRKFTNTLYIYIPDNCRSW